MPEETPNVAPRKCAGNLHVVKDIDSAGAGVCVCTNYRVFGQPVHGQKVWHVVEVPA